MEKTWEIMIDSDILIMSKSSFSWVPAMYNQNLVIYPECWLKKLPKWVNSKDNDLEKKITLYINERFSG